MTTFLDPAWFRGTEEEDGDVLRQMLFGPESQLCQMIRHDPRQLAVLLQDGLTENGRYVEGRKDRPLGGACGDGTVGVQAEYQALLILRGLFAALNLSQCQPTDEKFRIYVSDALRAFDSAYQPVTELPAAPSIPRTIGNVEPFHEAAVAYYARGSLAARPSTFWLVWDVVQRLKSARVTSRDLHSANLTDDLQAHAVTQVLLCQHERFRNIDEFVGTITRLHVELLKDQGRGFFPDPLRMGALPFPTIKEEDEDHGFLTAMQHAWNCSGLEALGYRGRWYLTGLKRSRQERDFFHPPYVIGRSAEAAACAALWAAHGGIPNVEPCDSGPEVMDETIAVSAALERDESSNPMDRRLLNVGAEWQKCQAAAEQGIRTVVLSEQESSVHDGSVERTTITYQHNIEIESVATIGDAYDLLLENNRYVKAYQRRELNHWKHRWPQAKDV